MDGIQTKASEASFWLYLYNSRRALSEMGYKFDLNDLDIYEAEVFLQIHNCYAKEVNERMKRKGKVSGRSITR